MFVLKKVPTWSIAASLHKKIGKIAIRRFFLVNFIEMVTNPI